jgi:hypothetical protein
MTVYLPAIYALVMACWPTVLRLNLSENNIHTFVVCILIKQPDITYTQVTSHTWVESATVAMLRSVRSVAMNGSNWMPGSLDSTM